MKHLYFYFLFVAIFPVTVLSQTNEITPVGGGEYIFKSVQCISPQQRETIISLLDKNVARLKAEGKLRTDNNREQAVLFDWPLRQGNGANDPGYYGISNYVDQNTAYPGQVQDYNCGNRTYDNAGGYNHQGTDIFTWPFSQLKQANNWVEVIAAEAGTIIGKVDGNSDNSCSFCTACNWNAVYIQHADGSVAWYGHFKKNSLTSKLTGQTVAKGEYLGVVGSSGNSTGPHLHFEVYKSATYDLANRIDPFAGTCNSLNGTTSWWAIQKPYWEPMVNKLMTHSAAPNFGSCPSLEVTNEKTVFNPGESAIFAAYYRDQVNGSVTNFKIYRPDNSVFQNWSYTALTTYSASYWYWTWNLPSNAPGGVWKFEATYNGVTNSINFIVNFPTAVNDIINERGVRVFPNPVKDRLFLSFFKPVNGIRMDIKNLLGQKLIMINKNNFRLGTESVTVSSLAKGLYTLSVWEEGKLIYRGKFVKQ